MRLLATGETRAPAIVGEALMTAPQRGGGRMKAPPHSHHRRLERHRPRAGAGLCARGTQPRLYGRDAGRLEETAAACRAARRRGRHHDRRCARPPRHGASASPTPMRARRSISSSPTPASRTGLASGQIAEDPDAVRGLLAINVHGVFNTVEPAIAAMTARRKGQIAVVGSMAGLRGLPYSPAYCASKAAVHLYADSLRGALAPHGVHVSLIVPGFVTTPMNAKLESWQPGRMSDDEGRGDHPARSRAQCGCDRLSAVRLLCDEAVCVAAAARRRFGHAPLRCDRASDP